MNHVVANRAFWDGQADTFGEWATGLWAAAEPTWGIWNVPQSQLPVVPDDVRGLDVVELGCGTAYVSSWLARRGARPVGLDNSARQLATARRLQSEFDLRFPLIQADAECVPLAGASCDLAISEYGAAIWCDPYRWIPEAARILRPGGRLVFVRNSTLLMLCVPEEGVAGGRLLRPQFGLHRMSWPDSGVEFHLPHGEWIRLLRANGFTVTDLVEVRAPEGATTNFEYVTPQWARRWPSEEVWFATLTGQGTTR